MTDSEKLDLILSDVQDLKQRTVNIENNVTNIENKVANIENNVTNIENKVADIENNVTNIENKVANIENNVTNIGNKVTNIELVIENEIRVNIQRVAEGHLDLSRNLHEALKTDSEKEMLAIRVGVLETEVKRIKTQLEIA